MRAVLALGAVMAALLVAGCGGDGDKSAGPPPKAPELTVPGEDTAPTIPETPGQGSGTDTTPAAPGQAGAPGSGGGSGGTPSQGGGGGAGGGAASPDGPGNDTPPPAGSPEQRFEQGCDANPSACD